MKYLLLSILMIACSKSPDQVQSQIKSPIPDVNQQTNLNSDTSRFSEDENKQGSFQINLGIHEIEYFADRLIIKAKRAGYDFATKKSFTQDGRKLHKIVLGPFASYAEAKSADDKIKGIAPDIESSEIVPAKQTVKLLESPESEFTGRKFDDELKKANEIFEKTLD